MAKTTYRSRAAEKKQIYLDKETDDRLQKVIEKSGLGLCFQEAVETAICRFLKRVEADPDLLKGRQNRFGDESTPRRLLSLSVKEDKYSELKKLADSMGVSLASLVSRAILHEAEARGL